MESFEKLAAFLDTFSPEDENYDYACYVKHKLAGELDAHVQSVLDTADDKDVEETGELAENDKSNENIEGRLMEPAFKDLEEPTEISKKAEISHGIYIRELLDLLRK